MKNNSPFTVLLQTNPFLKGIAIVGALLMTMTIESGVIFIVHLLQV